MGTTLFGDVKIITVEDTLLKILLPNNNLCLMNDKSYTCLHLATGHLSFLDLSVSPISLFRL